MTIDIEAWLIVSQAPGIGGLKFHKLLKKIGKPEEIVKIPKSELQKSGLDEKAINFIKNPPAEKINPSLNWAKTKGNTIRTLFCQPYPEMLREIRDAPPLLYIKGDEQLLKEPQIAVIGSRQPTPGGRAITKKFSHEIAKAGLLINSGMADGVDAVAHNTALQSSSTVAVVATGPDKIYPAKNKPLAERIAKQGVLVSEFPVGTEPVRANFPRRNRIISALSLGVVVIEAARKSGALITARLAAEQGKEVFAVPGSIYNPKAQGCHYLIQQGAQLVEKAEDILLELQPQLEYYVQKGSTNKKTRKEGATVEMNQVKLSDTHTRVLESMGYDPVDVNTLVERCQLSTQAVSAALLALEIENYVGEDGGLYTRVR